MSQGFTRSTAIIDAGDLIGDTLAPNVVFSSLTQVGALNSGSIVAGFSGIDATPIGAVTPSSGAFTTVTVSGTLNAASLNATNGNVAITRTGSAPRLILVEKDAAVDNEIWDHLASGGQLAFRVLNDAQSVSTSWLTVARTGTTVDSVNLFGTAVAVAGTLNVVGNLTVSGTGPHAIGGAADTRDFLVLRGSFTGSGSGTSAEGLVSFINVTGAPGDTTRLTGVRFSNTIVTQTATESIAVVAQAQFDEPVITNNLTGNITLAATVYVSGAPTEGVANSALHVVSGRAFMGGDFEHAGSNFGVFGSTPVGQTAAYTPTNVTPDRAYDANSTTIDEIADVLGTIIADLQTFGFFA